MKNVYTNMVKRAFRLMLEMWENSNLLSAQQWHFERLMQLRAHIYNTAEGPEDMTYALDPVVSEGNERLATIEGLQDLIKANADLIDHITRQIEVGPPNSLDPWFASQTPDDILYTISQLKHSYDYFRSTMRSDSPQALAIFYLYKAIQEKIRHNVALNAILRQ